MSVLLTIRWQWLATLRHPASWVGLVLVGVAWPTLSTLMGLGLNTAALVPTAALWQIGLLSLLGGSTLGMYRLCKQAWWAQRTPPLQAACIETGTIASMGVVFFAISTCTAVAAEGWALWLPALGNAALAAVHAGLLGSLCMAWTPGWPPVTRALLLPVSGWLVPAWLQGDSWVERVLRQSLELARYFEFPLDANSPASLWWTALGTLAGLTCCRVALLVLHSPKPCATPS